MNTNKNAPKYKVGDKVKIVSKRTERMNPDGFMDRYLDTIMTIREAFCTGGYKMEEDRQDAKEFGKDGWFWYEEMIDHKVKKINVKVKVKPRPDLANLTNSTPQTPPKITGFERAVYGDTFWYNGIYYTVERDTEIEGCNDDQLFETANYYTNETLAEWCRRSDELTRRMRRWAAEHNVEPFDWQCGNYEKYYITFDAAFYEFNIYSNTFCPYPNTVYFNTKEIAELAIKEFGNEIEWLAENRPEWF